MGLFFSKRSVFDDPNSYPLNETGILSWLQGWQTATGRTVSVESAMGMAAVFRSIQIISQVGTLPLRVYRLDNLKPVTTSIATSSKPLTQYEIWGSQVGQLASRGKSFVFKQRDPAGPIVGLLPIHPSRVQVKVVNGNAIGVPFVKQFIVDGQHYYTSYDIMHTHIMSDDGIDGRGPLEYCRNAISIGQSAEEAAGRMYDSGMMLSGILSSEEELSQEQADALKAAWAAKTGGTSHAGDVAVLGNGAKFQQITLNPADAQFIQSRQFQRSDIAAMFGLQPWMLGEVERSTGQGPGVSAQLTTLTKLTLSMYATALEQKISQELLPNTQDCKFDLGAFSRGDDNERAAFYTAAIAGGWMTPNDVRARENLPPVAWGDQPWLPNNTAADNPAQDGQGGQSKDEPKDPGGKDDS
jgi:HK97 family phage portal protein